MAAAQIDLDVRPALINGAVGWIALRDGEPFSLGAISVRGGKVVEIDILTDPDRLSRLDLTAFGTRG
jgi:RNA polymerase sigma-70 factor (ECF subfamily)